MSPLSGSRLFVALQPDRIALMRERGVWRRRIVAKHVLPCHPEAGWAGAVASLAPLLADPAWRGCKVEVVLSARYCRAAIMPPLSGLRGSEVARLARHCLEAAHGTGLEGWLLAFGETAWNADRIVCAVEPGLMDALDAAIRAGGGRLISLRPFPMSAFDGRRQYFASGDAWFAAIEPGWCTLGRIEGGVWRSIRTRRLFSGKGDEIATLLAQEKLLADTEETPRRVVVASPNAPQLTIPSLEVTAAGPRARLGFSAIDDAAAAMALEGAR